MALSSHLNRESLTFTQARVNGPTRRGARWEFAQPHVTRPRRSGPGGPRSSARAAWRRRRPRSTGEPRPVRLTGRRSPRARTSHAARSAPGPAEVTLTRPRFLVRGVQDARWRRLLHEATDAGWRGQGWGWVQIQPGAPRWKPASLPLIKLNLSEGPGLGFCAAFCSWDGRICIVRTRFASYFPALVHRWDQAT